MNIFNNVATQRRDLKINTFLSMAYQLSSLSTCSRLSVGAIITDQNFKVLSMGYNGRAHNAIHCVCQVKNPEPGKCNCIHRQQNRIIFGGHYYEIPNKKIFLTVAPCLTCRKMLNQFKIKQVYYLNTYRDEEPLQYLIQNKILCQKIK